MKKILVLICFFAFTHAFAGESITWYSGSIVLSTSEVLTGEISVQHADVILFKKGESIMVYPAHRISALYFYDEGANVNRKYVSLKGEHTVFRIYHLYEVVLYGEVRVLRKQKKRVTSPAAEASDKFDFDYYVTLNDHLFSLTHFRNTVYPELIKASGGQILSFTRENRLDPNLPDNAIRIIEFYNKGSKSNLFVSDLKQFQAAK